MGRFLNPDNRAFQDALNAKIYVDKTEFIEYTNSVLDTTEKFICNSRPRRFGKSMTADMLTAYYSKGCNSEGMFSSLNIGQSENFKKHLNQYDVFHLDIQWCMMDAKCPENTVAYINDQMIAELKEAYPGIVSETVETAYGALSQIYAETGRRFIVIIDEWDVLIRDEATNQGVQEAYINFLRGMFKGSEPSKFIRLAYLTGILPIKKIKTQSALNNFDEYTMLDAGNLAPFIGFTENEVKNLSQQYGKDFDEVKRWYDGYLLSDQHMYNPRAVVSVMLRGNYQSYWSQTGTYEAILPLMNKDFDGLKNSIMTMLSGDAVKVRTTSFQNDMVSFKNRDDVLTLLVHLGYLAYDQRKQTVYIPNEEIRREFIDALEENKWNELLRFEHESEKLLEATLDMNEEQVADCIEKIHMEYTSVIQYNDENSLSSVLAIAYLSTMQYYFKPIRELPAGRGFADFVYIPKTEYAESYPALVVELKWNKNVESAMQQIKSKKYPTSLWQYTGKILLIGINYDKKSKEHQCKIEELRK